MATVTIFANTNDKSLESFSSNCTTLQTGGGSFNDVALQAVGQHFQTPNFFAWQAFMAFDTSLVAAVSSAKLVIRINDSLHGATEFDVEARLIDFGATVENADWVPAASLTSLPLLATVNTTAVNANNILVDITETGGSFSNNLNFGGTTRLMLSSSIFRTGPCATGDQSFTFFGTSQTGTVDDPRIVITTIAAASSDNILNPSADDAINGWTTDTGATDFLSTAIDESVASDTDYIQSPVGPSSSQLYETNLETFADPLSSSGHVVHYRYKKNVAGGNIDLVASLRQGASTEIASWTHTNISNSFTTVDQTLSGAQADSITNYSDLRLRFAPNTVTSDIVPTLVADRASANSNATVTTVDLAVASMTVGNYLILRTAADNSGGGGAARTISVTNQTGTPLDLASLQTFQQNNDPGAASAGVTANVAIAKISATSGTVRITYSGAVVQACVAEEWSGVHATTPIVGTPVGANGVASTNLASVTDASVALGNVAYGVEAVEGPSTDTYTQDADTTNGSWSGLTKVGTTNATADTNMTIFGGYKVATATGGQTYNPTINNARDSAGLILELAAVAPTLRTQVSWANLELPQINPRMPLRRNPTLLQAVMRASVI